MDFRGLLVFLVEELLELMWSVRKRKEIGEKVYEGDQRSVEQVEFEKHKECCAMCYCERCEREQ